jgi:hypothetical protein
MVTFRVKLRFQARASCLIPMAQGGPRLARITGRVNHNLPWFRGMDLADRSAQTVCLPKCIREAG